MSSSPLLSVIVPVYQAEHSLERCVSSILGQSFTDLELILVEDGSPDASGALCDEWAARDGRVRVFHQPNGGPSAARNRGLAACRGKYISFVDADDSLLPGAYEAFVPRMEAEGLDLLCFGLQRASGAKEPVPEGRFSGLPGLADRLEYLLVDTGILASPVNKLYRASVLLKAPALLFDPGLTINEDLLFHLQLLLRCGPLALCPTPGYLVDDTRAGSLSRQPRTDLLSAERYTRPAFRQVLEKAGLNEAARQHMLDARRTSVCCIQFSLLTARPSGVPLAQMRRVFREILAFPPARAALRRRLAQDPNRLLALPYRICAACRFPGLLAGYCRLKDRLSSLL